MAVLFCVSRKGCIFTLQKIIQPSAAFEKEKKNPSKHMDAKSALIILFCATRHSEVLESEHSTDSIFAKRLLHLSL